MKAGQIEKLNPAELRPHPSNRRVSGMNEERIEAIAAVLREAGDFWLGSLPLVRPVNGHRQIVVGHHRVEAARRAGLKAVSVAVEEMDDFEALARMSASNTQSEEDPLDVGLNALAAVEKGSGGRGKKGGVSDFARAVGRDKGQLSRLIAAAQVAETVDSSQQFRGLSSHLYAVSRAPAAAWNALIHRIAERKLATVSEVEKAVEDVKRVADKVPDALADFYPAQSVISIAAKGDISPKAMGDLVQSMLKITGLAEQMEPEDAAPYLRAAAAAAWDIGELVGVLRSIEGYLEEQRRLRPQIEQVRAEDYLPGVEDASVDLLLTDPPYSTDIEGNISAFVLGWLPEALRKLKPTGRAYIFTGAYPEELHAYLTILFDCVSKADGWTLAPPLVWTYRNTLGPAPSHDYKLNWQACFYLYGPDAPALDCPLMTEQFAVQDVNAPDGRQGTRLHAWQKPDELAERIVRHATRPGDLVLDPFSGTGTFGLAACRLGRLAIGCEADPAMLAIYEEREKTTKRRAG